MAKTPDMVELCRFGSTVEAQLLQNRLLDHGIVTALQGAHLASNLGLLPSVAPCRVLIREDLLDEARAALALFAVADEPASRSDPEQCPACESPWEAGFDECWSCGHAL
ncbi:MAG: DUF2007 domain-containing protein [Myxococcota bacterium]